MLPKRIVGEQTRVWRARVRDSTNAHIDKRVDIGDWKGLHLVVELLDKLGPVLQADLEDLTIFDLGDSDQVEVSMCKEVSVRKIFNEL